MEGHETFNENVKAYYELQADLAIHETEEKDRLSRRAKARTLAKRILKEKAKVIAMQKELSEIFYFDGSNRAYGHMERTCDPKTEVIRDALKTEVH
jgi:hypothetical protein